MANELSIVVSVAFSKGGVSTQRSESISVDVTGEAFTHQVQAMTGGEAALDVGDAVGTTGYVFIKNLDSALYVDVGIETQPSIRLKPGQIALFPAIAAIWAVAESGTVKIEYWIIEV